MLTGLYGFALALILVMRLAPRSPLGRVLLTQLVDRPLGWLSRLERHQLIAFILIGPMFLASGEMVALLGPELFMAYVIDLSLYLDVMAASLALAALGRFRSGWQAIRARLSAAVSRRQGPRNRRARRTPAVRRVSPPNNDDEPAVAWMLAA